MEPASLNQGLELATEFLDPGDNRDCARIAQNADRFSSHLLGDVEECIQILHRSFAVTDALEYFRRPGCSFAALCALRTALVREKARNACDDRHHRLRVVDYNHAAGAEHRSLGHKALVVHEG